MVTLERGTDHLLLPQRELLYAARLENAGPKALIVPIGDPRYGVLSGSTLTTVGAQQLTFTNKSGNWDAMATPLRSTALIPIWTPDGSSDYITTPDADFWTGTADGTAANEPSLTLAVWIKVVAAAAEQIIWAKTNASGTQGSDWITYMDSSERPTCKATDDSAGAQIGRRDATPVTEAWHHLAFTKSTAVTSSAWKIYLDAVRVDDGNSQSGTYIAMENGTTVCAIGAGSIGGSDLQGPIAGGPCGPLADIGQVWSANKVLEDYRITRAALANQLGT